MQSVGLLFLRMFTGTIFAVHGFAKLFGGTGKKVHPLARRYLGDGFAQAMDRGGVANFSRGLEHMGVPAPRPAAIVVGGTEFVGGVLLITGVFTRLAALALAVNMICAIKLVHWKQGLIGSATGYMYALSLLGGMLAVLGSGPGAVSVDGKQERWLSGCWGVLRRKRRAAGRAER